MIKLSKNEIVQKLSNFNWTFKIGDNIIYNLKIIFKLYKIREIDDEKELFNKPLSILLTSVIEAVFIDFLIRIDEGTKHLPNNIDPLKINNIKDEISKEKKPKRQIDLLFGEYIYYKRKNYKFSDLIEIFRKYELFGSTESKIYDTLKRVCFFRNRVHILNYFQNFETDEKDVFTNLRLKTLEEIFDFIFTIMEYKYSRPLDENTINNNRNSWNEILK